MTEPSKPVLTGGCQCGAVRYALLAAPDKLCVCHCRMCQKASGGPVMAYARVGKHALRWTRGRPAAFRSSNLVERQFCSACGTPLTYNFVDSPYISVTSGTLDTPEAAPPAVQYGIESTLWWFPTITRLPGRASEELIAPDPAVQFVSFQHPDHDT